MIDLVSIPLIGSVFGGIIGNRSDNRWCEWMRQIEDMFRKNEPVNHHVHRAARRAMLMATRIEVRQQFEALCTPAVLITREVNQKKDALRQLDKWLTNEVGKTHDNRYVPAKSAADDQFNLLLTPGKSGNQRLNELKTQLQQQTLSEFENAKIGVPVSIREHILSDEWYGAVCGQFEYEIRRDTHLSDLLSNRLLAGLMDQLESGVEIPLDFSKFRSQLDEWGKPVLEKLEVIEKQLGKIDTTLQTNQEAFDFLIPMAMYLPDIAASQENLTRFITKAMQELHQSQQHGQQTTHDYFSTILQVLQTIREKIGDTHPPRTQPNRHNNLPEQTASFIPKQQEADELHQKMRQHTRVALSGLGGIGKTQTVLHVAHSLVDQYDYILWLTSEDIRFASDRLRQLVEELGIPGVDREHGETYLQAFLIWLRTETSKRWLLVIDNVDEPDELSDFFLQLPGQRGKVLLTSRAPAHRLAALNLLPDAVVVAKVMCEQEAMEFLFKRTNKPRNETTESQARRLVERLGYLPLALEQACAYLTQPGATLSDYLQSYEQKRLEWDRRYKPQMGNYPKSVGTTWLVSIERIQAGSPVSVLLLRLLAFFEPDSIPLWLIRVTAQAFEEPLKGAGANEANLRETLAPLISYSLLDYDGYAERDGEPVPHSCGLHRLVQEVVRDSIVTEQAQWVQTLLPVFKSIAPDPQAPKDWSTWRELLPHLLATLRTAEQIEIEPLIQAFLLNQAGVFLFAQGRYQAAEPLYKRTLKIFETQLGEDHPDTSGSLNNLADLYRAQGRYAEAEPLYKRALKIFETQLGEDHPSTATSLNNLAELYRAQGRYAEAEPLYERALKIRKTQLGKDHPDTATSLNSLAELYRAQGRYAKAEPLFKRALKIRKTKLGEDHPDTATSLNNLALLYKAQGRYAEAEPLYERALKIRKTKQGEDHPFTATSLNNLALLYKAQGRYAEAEPLYERALKISETQLGEDHPDTAGSLNNLAELYREQGRYAEAEPLYKRALKIRETQLGEDHPDTAGSLNNLAALYGAQGRYAKAEPLFKRALKIRKTQLGEDHPDTATSLNNLAALYDAQGRYAKAEPLFKRAVAILVKALGINHPNTMTVIRNYALCLLKQGKREEAASLLQQYPQASP